VSISLSISLSDVDPVVEMLRALFPPFVSSFPNNKKEAVLEEEGGRKRKEQKRGFDQMVLQPP